MPVGYVTESEAIQSAEVLISTPDRTAMPDTMVAERVMRP
jgi:hypothetical protein